MAEMRVSAACESLQKQENKATKCKDDDENVVEDSKGFILVEDSPVEEEDTEFDAAVGEFLDYKDGIIQLSRL